MGWRLEIDLLVIRSTRGKVKIRQIDPSVHGHQKFKNQRVERTQDPITRFSPSFTHAVSPRPPFIRLHISLVFPRQILDILLEPVPWERRQ